MGTIFELLESTLLLVQPVHLQKFEAWFSLQSFANLRGTRMACVEYHLLLTLIWLMNSGISLNLGKKNRVGFSNIHKEYQ